MRSLYRTGRFAGKSLLRRLLFITAIVAVMFGGLAKPAPARADTACTVMLCLAGNWRQISACQAPVRRVLRDLARGRAFPICAFASPSTRPTSSTGSLNATPTSAVAVSGTAHEPATGQNCPLQYRVPVRDIDTNRIVNWTCSFSGVIHTVVQGQPWSRTWWGMDGDTVTEWLPAARAAFTTSGTAMDDRFERDLAAWRVAEDLRLQEEARRKAEADRDTGGSGGGAGAGSGSGSGSGGGSGAGDGG
jgi:uncharacterized membrane protein YgcG